MTWDTNDRAAAIYAQRQSPARDFQPVGLVDAVEYVKAGLGIEEMSDPKVFAALADLNDYLASTSEKVVDQFVYDDEDENASLNIGLSILWSHATVARDGERAFVFVVEMATRSLNRGLSAGQVRGLLNCMRADALREARLQVEAEPFTDDEPEAVAPVAGEFSAVVESMQRLAATLSRPKVRLADDVVLSIAGPGARCPGTINVTSDTRFGGTFYGRIALDGTTTVQDEHARERMTAFAADPAAALATYGHATGQCGICGRTLTDPVSVEAGIGPICIGRFG